MEIKFWIVIKASWNWRHFVLLHRIFKNIVWKDMLLSPGLKRPGLFLEAKMLKLFFVCLYCVKCLLHIECCLCWESFFRIRRPPVSPWYRMLSYIRLLCGPHGSGVGHRGGHFWFYAQYNRKRRCIRWGMLWKCYSRFWGLGNLILEMSILNIDYLVYICIFFVYSIYIWNNGEKHGRF